MDQNLAAIEHVGRRQIPNSQREAYFLAATNHRPS